MADIDAFLQNTIWENWARETVAGDASRRSYQRLTGQNGETAILMIAPPELGEDIAKFIELSEYLRDHGITTPEVYRSDLTTGLAVITDLGREHFAAHLNSHISDENSLYLGATRIILDVIKVPPKPDMIRMIPEIAADMLEPFWAWHAPTIDRDHLRTTVQDLFASLDEPLALSLRDYHAENLVWRPNEPADKQIGVLDFQDAFAAHPVYDLVSLLRDARRDVSEETVQSCCSLFGDEFGMEREAFDRTFALISAQRNIRILGIFAALIKRDKKPKYAQFIPRVVGYLRRDLAHPHLQPLARIILPELPS